MYVSNNASNSTTRVVGIFVECLTEHSGFKVILLLVVVLATSQFSVSFVSLELLNAYSVIFV